MAIPLPKGYHSLNPYLNVRNAAGAIEFYEKVFGAINKGAMKMPDGKIGHAELMIGDSTLMLADENKEWGNPAPESVGGTASGIALYVDDVDAVFKRAVEAGATVLPGMEPKDQFYGDRSAGILDPFGHKWTIASHIEDVSPEEMAKRMKEWTDKQAKA